MGAASAAILCCLQLLPFSAAAHHAGAAIYDPTGSMEIDGVVTRIFWRNPHVHFEIRVTRANGDEEAWDVESNSISILSRMGITSKVLNLGDRVKVAGWPPRRPVATMFATNMLLPGGVEVLLAPRSRPHWSNDTLGVNDIWVTDGGETIAANAGDGIFRVWSTNMANPQSFPLFRDIFVVEDNYPLTDSARVAREIWDPVADNPYLGCTPMGMPRVMGQPYPIEFVDNGNEILLRIELYDIERNIVMNADSQSGEIARSALGHSTGRWEDGTLVVNTTHMSWRYFDQSGVPLGENAGIVERFTPDADNGRLLYSITVTDPATFTEPVTLRKYWSWRSGEHIQHYECTKFE